MKRSVLISVPTSPARPWIHKRVGFVTDRLLLDPRYSVTIIRPSWNPFEHSLHRIVNDFVAGPYDFWLTIDSDNPPLNNPLDLVEYDRDVIGLPTPVWHYDEKNKKPGERPIYWNAYQYDTPSGAYREWPTKEGLQQVDAVGTGCVLFSKRVFLDHAMQMGCFQRTWNDDGTVEKGNDIAFCERARACGFEIFAHFDYPCDHHNELSLIEVQKAFENLYQGGRNGSN